MLPILLLLIFGLPVANGAASNAVGSDPAAVSGTPSITFYYGNEPPVNMLSQFDWIVVEAAGVKPLQLSQLRAHGSVVFAYVSLGEQEHWRSGAQPCGGQCPTLGPNRAWDTSVIDLTQPGWSNYIVNQRIGALWKQGYRAFFLDTLDSFTLYAKDKAQVAAQRAALAALIRRIHDTYPGVKLLLNRGFDVLPEIHDVVAGVVAESLFRQWDASGKAYTPVSPADSEWLLGKLREVQQRWHLPVAVIDYLPPKDREASRADARRIAALGFTPWVSNAALDEMGVGAIEAMPREVLMLYELSADDPTDDVANHGVNLDAALPLEYMGYVPVYHDMADPLPADTLTGRYAGIVAWFPDRVRHDPHAYTRWLLKQMDDGVPVAFIGDPGVPLAGPLLEKMGLRLAASVDAGRLRVLSHDDLLGFETFPPVVPPDDGGYVPVRADVHAHLWLQAGHGERLSPVLTGPWGGIALNPWVLNSSPLTDQVDNGEGGGSGIQDRWILDPFKFFRTALHLPDMPVVDATTENGSRIATAHIDGDGFASRANVPGTPFAGQVIRDRILKRFDFPTTVSVITGAIRSDGLFPEIAPQLQALARSIFRLRNVEIASHTYSHPFDWHEMQPGMASGAHNLPLKGYRYSLKREIDGSVRYIDTHLAPPGKRVKVLLWSGDALPPAQAVAMTDALGIANMNGGVTDVTWRNHSITNVSPMTRPAGAWTQVYAPVINDNVFTNGYKGPYWGFARVLQTFELTDMPRRLKPVTIYYHFFSGTRPGATDAIAKAYEYALSHQTLPMFESAYYALVMDYRRIGVARALDGSWIISGATQDRTLRLGPNEWPDLAASKGVVGVRTIPQGNYVALSGADRVVLKLRSEPPEHPYLQRANGRVAAFRRTDGGFDLKLKGEVPLRATLAQVGDCRVSAPGARQTRQPDSGVQLDWGNRETGDATVLCR